MLTDSSEHNPNLLSQFIETLSKEKDSADKFENPAGLFYLLFTTDCRYSIFKNLVIKTKDNKELSLFEKQLLYIEVHAIFFNYLFDLLAKSPRDLEGRKFLFYGLAFINQHLKNNPTKV